MAYCLSVMMAKRIGQHSSEGKVIMKKNVLLAIAAFVVAGMVSDNYAADGVKAGDTAVLKWKDGKKAVFLLAFDDSCDSHLKTAIPLLRQYGMVGTFYVNQGKAQY